LALKELQYSIAQGIIVVNDFDFDLSVVISFSNKKEKIYENVNYGFNVLVKENKLIICANDLTALAKERAAKNTKVIKMIQTAINNDNIISYFQPITNNKTMEVEKYESLVRLIDDDGKVLSPYFFLDIAKESGYYSKITNIVLTNSFKALMQTTKEISMNLSAIDIENPHIRSKIMILLEQHKDDTHRVVFELLEDEKVKDFQVVKDFITHAKSYGVKIAIDDFGAGVSNFERLLDYQPDILKIDACLIKNIDQDKYSKDVVETIQLFAWKQDIKTVAEFVETPEILKTVKDIGINYTQGYLLGRPDRLENLC
jgi:EAL domain-containing protein (putative c-di-GMP-specific phosphodiesterase class I)